MVQVMTGSEPWRSQTSEPIVTQVSDAYMRPYTSIKFMSELNVPNPHAILECEFLKGAFLYLF